MESRGFAPNSPVLDRVGKSVGIAFAWHAGGKTCRTEVAIRSPPRYRSPKARGKSNDSFDVDWLVDGDLDHDRPGERHGLNRSHVGAAEARCGFHICDPR